MPRSDGMLRNPKLGLKDAAAQRSSRPEALRSSERDLQNNRSIAAKTASYVTCQGKKFTESPRLIILLLRHPEGNRFESENASTTSLNNIHNTQSSPLQQGGNPLRLKCDATKHKSNRSMTLRQQRPTRKLEKPLERKKDQNTQIHCPSNSRRKSFECTVCDKTFDFLHSLSRHLQTHSEKPRVCETFTQKKNMIGHSRIHTGERPYKCNVCSKTFLHQSNLHSHSLTHTVVKPFMCDVCEKCFTQKIHLIEHTRIHTGEKPFKCDICAKCFTQKTRLIEHTRIHTGEKPYKCNVCGRKFTQKGNQLRHIHTHTGEKPYKCDICAKSFTRKGDVIVHIRTHSEEKPYKCEVCGKEFTQESHLRRHSLTHTGEKPFMCDNCEKCFLSKGELVGHTRIHTGEKPYKCKVCGRKFTHQSTLRRHSLTHTGEKPFMCDICEKCFTRKMYLIEHTRIHTGEKPYKCKVRGRTFAQKTNQRSHTLTHTREKPYKCNLCDREFTQKMKLRRHSCAHTGGKFPEQKKISTKNSHQVDRSIVTGRHLLQCYVLVKRIDEIDSVDQNVRTKKEPIAFEGKCEPSLNSVSVTTKSFECNVCGENFSRKPSWLLHLRTHRSGKLIKFVPGQKTSNVANLRLTVSISEVSKPLECIACDQTFNDMKSLKDHFLSHSNRRK